jgi:hypothetical protein
MFRLAKNPAVILDRLLEYTNSGQLKWKSISEIGYACGDMESNGVSIDLDSLIIRSTKGTDPSVFFHYSAKDFDAFAYRNLYISICRSITDGNAVYIDIDELENILSRISMRL